MIHTIVSLNQVCAVHVECTFFGLGSGLMYPHSLSSLPKLEACSSVSGSSRPIVSGSRNVATNPMKLGKKGADGKARLEKICHH